METLINNNNIFDSTADMYDYKMATAFFCAIKSGRGVLISSVLPEDITVSRTYGYPMNEQSGAFEELAVEKVTVMVEHADVHQYLHTLKAVTNWLAVEFPSVSMKAEQHGYDIEFTLEHNMYVNCDEVQS